MRGTASVESGSENKDEPTPKDGLVKVTTYEMKSSPGAAPE